MPKARKLRDFTVEEFNLLLRQHKTVPEIAKAKGVTYRAMAYWVAKNCPRRVVYGCQATSEGK